MNKEKLPDKTDVKTLWLAVKRIFRLSKPYRKKFYIATILAVGSSAVGLSVPLGLKALLDAVFQTADADLLNIISADIVGPFYRTGFSVIWQHLLAGVGWRAGGHGSSKTAL